LPRGYDQTLFVADGRGAVDPPVFDVGVAPFDEAATLYLFRGASSSLTLGFFSCPAGMTPDTLAGDFCEPSGADLRGRGGRHRRVSASRPPGCLGGERCLRDWDGLPAGTYAVRLTTLPSGYDEVVIPEAELDATTRASLVQLDPTTPEAQYSAFFLQESPPAASSVTVRVFDCPPGMGRDDLVGDICQASTGFDLALSTPEGGTLGLADAKFGGNVATWSDLPAGDYYVEENQPPRRIHRRVCAECCHIGLNPAAYLVSVGAAMAADIAIYNLRPDDQSRHWTATATV
jgi:hypothetical protein